MTEENSSAAAKSAGKKILMFFLRLLVAGALLIYSLTGMTAAVGLVKRGYHAGQDINTLKDIINDPKLAEHPKAVVEWLLARPLAETDALIGIIEPLSAKLDYSVFFELFRREMRLGRMQEAVFWEELGRFRLRYDVIRCTISKERMQQFSRLANMLPSGSVMDFLAGHPERLKAALQRVLDFDALYPAANDPLDFCKSFKKSALADMLGGYRPAMRKYLEDYIKELDKNPAGKVVLPPVLPAVTP